MRDGLFPIDGKKSDVLIVEVWSKEMRRTVTFIPRYQPFSSGQFKILGPALVGVDGIAQVAGASKRLDDILDRGVSEHPKAGSLWAPVVFKLRRSRYPSSEVIYASRPAT